MFYETICNVSVVARVTKIRFPQKNATVSQKIDSTLLPNAGEVYNYFLFRTIRFTR